MKKTFAFLILFGALLIPRSAHAGFTEPGLVYQVAISSQIQSVVTVSTAPGANGLQGATQMDSPQLVGRATIEIQNIDSTANLWCTLVSTTPTANNGRKIASGNSWIINLSDKATQMFNQTLFKIWCLSDGAASTKAFVTQLY
jgi:hypothetical protein